MKPARTLSLLELVTVLAVLMVLGALAIPAFRERQLRSRKAELATVVEGIDAASAAYHAAADAYYTIDPWFEPDVAPGKQLRAWDGFSVIGFHVDGEVRGSYTIARRGGTVCYQTPLSTTACPTNVCAAGMTDLDGDWIRSCTWKSEGLAPRWINELRY